MKFMKYVTAILLSFSFNMVASATGTVKQVMELQPIQSLNFSEYENKFSARTRYPANCYFPEDVKVNVYKDEIRIGHLATRPLRPCLRVINFDRIRFDVSEVAQGRYKLIDVFDGQRLGFVSIDESGDIDYQPAGQSY